MKIKLWNRPYQKPSDTTKVQEEFKLCIVFACPYVYECSSGHMNEYDFYKWNQN